MTDREEVPLDVDELEGVTHGALVTVAAVVAQKVLLFGTNLALTHGLGVTAYGLYAYGQRLMMMLRGVASVGVKSSLLRFVPAAAGDGGRRNRLLGIGTATTLVASTLVGAALFAFAPTVNAYTVGHPEFPAVLRAFAAVVPLYVLVGVVSSSFRALERPVAQALVARIGRPGARLLGVAVPLALGLSVVGVVAGVAVATALLLVVSAAFLLRRTELRPAVPRVGEVKEYGSYALPVTAATMGRLLRSRVDVLLVGFLLTAGDAGVYNVALFLTSFITLPLIAFNQLMPPVASRLYEDGDVAQVDQLYGTVTRLVFTGAAFVAAVEAVYGPELLALFGAAYGRGHGVLLAFVLGRLVHAGVGATGWLLLMTDNQTVEAVNNWILGALNIGLSYVFVLRFGLIGAALGTAGSLALMNLVRVAQLRHLEDLFAFDRSYLKPLAAGLAAVGALFAVDLVLGGVPLLVVGTAAGAVAFGTTLYALGIEAADRALVGALVDAYR